MTSAPSKDEIAEGLRERIASINERLREYDELRREKESLEAALQALEDGPGRAQADQRKSRSPREVVRVRRQEIKDLLAEDPELSTKEIAKRTGQSYQTVANDLRAIEDGK